MRDDGESLILDFLDRCDADSVVLSLRYDRVRLPWGEVALSNLWLLYAAAVFLVTSCGEDDCIVAAFVVNF